MKPNFPLLIVAIYLFASNLMAQTANDSIRVTDPIQVTDTIDYRYLIDPLIYYLLEELLEVQLDEYPEDEPVEAPIEEPRVVVPLIRRHVYHNPLDLLFERDPRTNTLRLPPPPDRSEEIFSFRDTIIVNPLFLPIVFDGRILPRNVSFLSSEFEAMRGLLIPQSNTFAPQLARVDFAQQVRRQFYVDHPTQIRHRIEDLPQTSLGREDEHIPSFDPYQVLVRREVTFELTGPSLERIPIQRRYWQRSGDHRVQFAQIFFSDNFQRGGVSHTNIDSEQRLNANFRRNDVNFNNTLTWRLGLNTTPNDTLRNYNFSNDMIRYEGSFGINAFFGTGWTYSTNLTAETRLFNEFPANSNELRSAFLAPLRVNSGIGLAYTLDRRSETVRHRRIRIERTNFNPISVQFIFVRHPDVDVRRHNIDEGKRHVLTPGSTLNFQMTYNFNRFVTWTTRFHFFTGYSNVFSEFENRLHMYLTTHLSTTIELNLRYDDSRERDETFGHLQVNQALRLGLRYTW